MIYIYVGLRIETNKDHIRGHISSGHYGPIWLKWPKLTKIAVMAWSDMATNMVNIDFHAKGIEK